MNITKNLSTFFDETKNIYINIAIVLGLIIFFIILPLPIPENICKIAKLIIFGTLIYLLIENFNASMKLMKNNNKSEKENRVIENSLILSSIVNVLLLILIIYIWYIIFF